MPRERFAWKRVRHHAPNAVWPPQGIHLQMHYRMPEPAAGRSAALASDAGRELLLAAALDGATALPAGWVARVSTRHPRGSVTNEGKAGEIFTPPHTHGFIERALPPGVRIVETRIDPGTDRSASWGPGLALVWEDGRVIKLNLGSGGFDAEAKPAFGCFDGSREWFNLGKGEPSLDAAVSMRLRLDGDAVFCEALHERTWKTYHKVVIDASLGDPALVRLGKLDKTGAASDHAGPHGDPGRLRIERFAAYGVLNEATLANALPGAPPLTLTVHYELYDGVPVFCKWLTVHNGGKSPITVDRFTSEILAVAEEHNPVESRAGIAQPVPQMLHVETDFAFGGFNHEHRIIRDFYQWCRSQGIYLNVPDQRHARRVQPARPRSHPHARPRPLLHRPRRPRPRLTHGRR